MLNSAKACAPPGSPGGAPGALLLPLSASHELACRDTLAALGDPVLRAAAVRSGALPGPVLGILRLLDDPELERTVAGFRALRRQQPWGPGREGELRDGRRTLFRNLRGRHPEAMAALREAFGAPPAGAGENYVVIDVFTWLIVIVIGVNGCSDHPFADMEPGE